MYLKFLVHDEHLRLRNAERPHADCIPCITNSVLQMVWSRFNIPWACIKVYFTYASCSNVARLNVSAVRLIMDSRPNMPLWWSKLVFGLPALPSAFDVSSREISRLSRSRRSMMPLHCTAPGKSPHQRWSLRAAPVLPEQTSAFYHSPVECISRMP